MEMIFLRQGWKYL